MPAVQRPHHACQGPAADYIADCIYDLIHFETRIDPGLSGPPVRIDRQNETITVRSSSFAQFHSLVGRAALWVAGRRRGELWFPEIVHEGHRLACNSSVTSYIAAAVKDLIGFDTKIDPRLRDTSVEIDREDRLIRVRPSSAIRYHSLVGRAALWIVGDRRGEIWCPEFRAQPHLQLLQGGAS